MSKNESTTGLVSHARKVLAHQEKLANGETPEDAGELVPADPAFVAVDGYRVRKRVTMPVLPFPVGATYVCRILDAIHVSDVEDSKFGPARVCQVEAPNGEVRLLIAGEVLATALARAYPDDGYVGAWFQITKQVPREGKRYADYAIAEIDPPMVTAGAAA
jgi:hypothetical protein